MLQTIKAASSNNLVGNAVSNGRSNDRIVKLEKWISNEVKWDIIDLFLIAPPPEDFNYNADVKYLYYRNTKLVGIIAYNLGRIAHEEVPLFIHVIGHPDFTHTRKAYAFLYNTFRDMKLKYNIIVAHIPNDRQQMIRLALRAGFVMYSEDKDSKYYYLDLAKIGD